MSEKIGLKVPMFSRGVTTGSLFFSFEFLVEVKHFFC